LNNKANKRPPSCRLSTGYHELDRFIGGLQPGDLVVVAAPSGHGKSAFVLNLVANASLKGSSKAAVLSLTMSAEQTAVNLACITAGVDQHKLRRGHLNKRDWQRFLHVGRHLASAPIWIWDCSDGDVSLTQIFSQVRNVVGRGHPGLLVVDSMNGLCELSDSWPAPTRDAVVVTANKLKGLARIANVAVVVTVNMENCDLGKGADHRPRLKDLQEYRPLELIADVILLLNRPLQGARFCVEVARNRKGPVGWFYLTHKPTQMRFETGAAYGQ
jgi:replicative DNA helicase